MFFTGNLDVSTKRNETKIISKGDNPIMFKSKCTLSNVVVVNVFLIVKI